MSDNRQSKLDATLEQQEQQKSVKINALSIRNYRFFSDTEERFPFEGKNALFYGENGSGKSSVYKALKILTRHSFDTNELLNERNIFSSGEQATLTYNFDNGDELIVDENKTSIDSEYLKNMSTFFPFLNYKKLLRVHFDMTEKKEDFDILPVLHKILAHYPVEGGKTLKDIKVMKEYYETLDRVLNKELLDEINTIITHFSADFTIEKFIVDEKEGEKKQPLKYVTMRLKQQYSNGDESFDIPYYHLFMNESRLSILAVAIYFAIIKKLSSGSPESLKILVLDDILISLDMSNRWYLLTLLLEHFSDFQIFLFTHDRALFEFIRSSVDRSAWTFHEMYVDDREGFEKPHIIPSLDYFQKAEKYLIEKDYPACANYLRKELERLLKKAVCKKPCDEHLQLENLLHRIEVKDSGKDVVKKAKNLVEQDTTKNYIKEGTVPEDLQGRLDTLKKTVENMDESDASLEQTKQLIENLKRFKDWILNPQSHDDTSKPVFKAELEHVVENINAIGKLLDKSSYEHYKKSSNETEKKKIGTIKRPIYNDKKYFSRQTDFEKRWSDALNKESVVLPEKTGWFDIALFPVVSKNYFSAPVFIRDNFVPVKVGMFDPFPRKKRGYFGKNFWHSDSVDKNYISVFTVYKDLFVKIREPYCDDLGTTGNTTKTIYFPEIMTKITQSLMLAKLFYDNFLNTEQFIAIKWTMTETMNRVLRTPEYNGWTITSVHPQSESVDIEIEKVIRLDELNNYYEISKEVIDIIFQHFKWTSGVGYVDEFLAEFKDFF